MLLATTQQLGAAATLLAAKRTPKCTLCVRMSCSVLKNFPLVGQQYQKQGATASTTTFNPKLGFLISKIANKHNLKTVSMDPDSELQNGFFKLEVR